MELAELLAGTDLATGLLLVVDLDSSDSVVVVPRGATAAVVTPFGLAVPSGTESTNSWSG